MLGARWAQDPKGPGRMAPAGAMWWHRCPHPPPGACSQRPSVRPLPWPARGRPPMSSLGAAAARWLSPGTPPASLGTHPLPTPFQQPASLPSPSSVPSPTVTAPGGLGGEEEGRGGRQQGWFWPRQRLSPPSPPEFPAGGSAASAFLPAPGGWLSTPSSCWSCSWGASAPAPWATSPSSCRVPG